MGPNGVAWDQMWLYVTECGYMRPHMVACDQMWLHVTECECAHHGARWCWATCRRSRGVSIWCTGRGLSSDTSPQTLLLLLLPRSVTLFQLSALAPVTSLPAWSKAGAHALIPTHEINERYYYFVLRVLLCQ
eukprot:8510560-Pyramimonas_sp.AAC.1